MGNQKQRKTKKSWWMSAIALLAITTFAWLHQEDPTPTQTGRIPIELVSTIDGLSL
ncbi:hypothetical protein [Sporosarcina sp. Te-1]|uniref:hypothetical protein n=1 Tax=Sporosarcina sp. Te-1 TaxID=2818390 RepID=UPI001A9CF231|nr:hypothetical protein [Sporosarcina sp. Te-1]QTD42646.1 hypothetical protein J3U78_07555 [Sporosarcina sp. Te-1]